MTLRSSLGSMFAPLLIHGLNQNQAMQRAASAKAQGLEPDAFGTTYPGSTVTTTNNNNAGGWIKGALLGAGLLMGGGAAAAGLSRLAAPAGQVTTPPPAIRQTAPATPAWDAIWEEQQPDGSWKQTDRQRLKP